MEVSATFVAKMTFRVLGGATLKALFCSAGVRRAYNGHTSSCSGDYQHQTCAHTPNSTDLGLFGFYTRQVQLKLALYAFDIVLTSEEDEYVTWRKEVMYLEDGFDRSFDIVLCGCIEVFDIDFVRSAFYVEYFGTIGSRQHLVSAFLLGSTTYHRNR